MDSYASQLMELWPNLTAVSVVGGQADVNNALINKFGNNLHFLVHSHNGNQFLDFSKINFNKLKELLMQRY